ncbi:oxygen-independent coproporphyrinogen III oxidase [Hydromonas duriensis]|uniref:Coproporphyrinogen-III oxidase n=1 Tax=Hydromonas duriensis TaxID=1527608 RepID=A0A4R6Y5W7_9BURK|nr:oxygen-independent coproporphyrinogen III oxidase [Hydromonas duriensis]TDR30762.1 oxygen-independent coproporphyrinogen-3 oxidase [Hydromonas duriensis]
MTSLIQKYNIPGPRYTSYPTVPYWNENDFTTELYLDSLTRSFIESNVKEGISLYIHLPFCESLCTFCACHKRITKNHSHEEGYIQAIAREWQMYLEHFKKHTGETVNIKEIHLGGGTPTFFSPENLQLMMNSLLKDVRVADDHEFSFEGHPNNTTREHLQSLYDVGFRRVSFGVQDYDARVQKAIHRIQPFENVEKVHIAAREIGYTSISHDLIFGLPFQTIDSVRNTIEQTCGLAPDRLAFYSYAHVPWIKGNGQRGFDDQDLPSAELKRELYELGKDLFAQNGYIEVGMDHFARTNDGLCQAMHNNTLHRNFMGYTTTTTQLMIGLGVSAISDSWYGFAQNEKNLDAYLQRVNNGEWPLMRGHLLTQEDLIIRRHILNLMCRLHTGWRDESMQFTALNDTLSRLTEMQNDGLLHIDDNSLTITELGRPFVRNVCMAFDLRMLAKQPEAQLFSMTI